MRRLAAILLLPLLCLASAPAQVTLVGAAPSADSVAQGAPAVVELTFSQGVKPAQSRIMVRGGDGRRYDTGPDHWVDDSQHLAVALKLLTPGHYQVTWQVAGMNGQRAAGSYGFIVNP